jgi:hypothetical protein
VQWARYAEHVEKTNGHRTERETTMESNTLSDPGRFAQAIRALARDAHEALHHSPSAADLRGLSRRIEVLAAVHGDNPGGSVGTWLDNLGRSVRSAAVHRDEASISM